MEQVDKNIFKYSTQPSLAKSNIILVRLTWFSKRRGSLRDYKRKPKHNHRNKIHFKHFQFPSFLWFKIIDGLICWETELTLMTEPQSVKEFSTNHSVLFQFIDQWESRCNLSSLKRTDRKHFQTEKIIWVPSFPPLGKFAGRKFNSIWNFSS